VTVGQSQVGYNGVVYHISLQPVSSPPCTLCRQMSCLTRVNIKIQVRDAITSRQPYVSQLHWLPVCQQVDFEVATATYHLLAGTAPVYLADECTLVTVAGHHPLRSADKHAWSRGNATSSVTTV